MLDVFLIDINKGTFFPEVDYERKGTFSKVNKTNDGKSIIVWLGKI